MPKQRITKEMIVDAAFEIARNEGMEQVLVKNIAEKLSCSVQPIYSYCTNMDGLRCEVEGKAREFLQDYVGKHLNQEDLFRSSGRAYISLAKDEPHIFKIFLLQERNQILSLDDVYNKETNPMMAGLIAKDLGISLVAARKLHLNMLIYTMGLSIIFAVSEPGIAIDEIMEKQDQAYEIFLKEALADKQK